MTKSGSLKRTSLVLAILILSILFWFLLPQSDDGGAFDRGSLVDMTEQRLRSVAVLPFQDLSQELADGSVADGVTLDLVTGLSKIHAIRVPASTSSFAFKGRYQNVSEIGKQLKVDTVLEGSVRIIENRARVTAQLLLVEDGYQIWSESYDVQFTDVLDLQDQVTAKILDSVRLHLI